MVVPPATIRAASRAVLFLSPIWPEPASSAAGVRTEALIRAFQSWNYDVSYAAGAKSNSYTDLLKTYGVNVYHVGPNRKEQLADVLRACRPDVVVFDRFMAEEAFSFRIRELSPQSLRVLDMQDLHSLRLSRQTLLEANAEASVADVLNHTPDATSESLLRELAAVHRSDLTLVCSPVEERLLQEYAVPASKLCMASFFCNEASRDNDSGTTGFAYGAQHGFEQRAGFVTIGGFKHAPNVDGVRWLADEIWPHIRAALPPKEREGAVMRVYGAYPTQAMQSLHAPRNGFLICNHAKSLQVLAAHRVLVAPLRFGAGIKGKIVDAWRYGLPVASTSIGAEGMRGASLGWGGLIADDAQALAACAARLYMDRGAWQLTQKRGRELLQELYSPGANLAAIRQAIDAASSDIDARRARDCTAGMLWHQTARSTEYFSRWIELKEAAAGRQNAAPLLPHSLQR